MDHILTTDRLVLRPFTQHELYLFHKLNTDPFIRRFLWDDEVISLDAAEQVLRKNTAHFEKTKFGLWKIHLKESLEVIGYTGLWYFFDEPQPQLIYAVLEKYTSRGYATESAQAVMAYAFSELGFQYLTAATDEPHLASQKVARRLGMRFYEKRTENGKPTLFYRIDKG